MRQRTCIFLPVSAVEGLVINRFDCLRFDATRIDAYAIGVRPWDIKRLNAALLAEIMLCEATPESIKRQRVLSLG